MRVLGLRVNLRGTDSFVRQEWPNRPSQEDYPTDLPEGYFVVCGFGDGRGENAIERLNIPETFDEMMDLYDRYWMGGSERINWYIGHEEITIFT